MEGWLEFALERYNYWIVIILMMTGLYIVFARGNLVKKIVGLNVFQTSVFIFYITIGKSAGGTAPIFVGDSYKSKDYKDGAKEGYDGSSPGDAQGLDAEAGDLHGKIDNIAANDLKAATDALGPAEGTADAPSLHQTPEEFADKVSNDALATIEKSKEGFEVAGEAAKDAGYGAAEAVSGVADVVYTNPLPHVLILTAIVVGVATTAVGLALAVRIREAYGTIEEDELDALDHVAEFGEEPATAQGGAA